MKRLKFETAFFAVALALLLVGCLLLSNYANGRIGSIAEALESIPADDGDPAGEVRSFSRKAAEDIENRMKSAEKSLALFVRYDYLNRATAAASAYRAALNGDEMSDVSSARRALAEALEGLMRINEFSAEIFF